MIQVLVNAVGETLTETAGVGLEPGLPEPVPLGLLEVLPPPGARYWLS